MPQELWGLIYTIILHWGVYKVGQEKFDTYVNKRRKISEIFVSFQKKNRGNVQTRNFLIFLCKKVYWNSCESAFKSFCVGFWPALIGFVPLYTVPLYTPQCIKMTLIMLNFQKMVSKSTGFTQGRKISKEITKVVFWSWLKVSKL